MGVSTVAIGALPTYAAIGVAAPALLALCRFGQGFGLGGEWAGAVLLAVENAPPGRRALYGMFPQLGAPFGLFLSNLVFIALTGSMTEEQFVDFGWRIPFLASAVLVLVGLWVRLRITETPVFAAAMRRRERVEVPMLDVLRKHPRMLIAGMLSALATFVLFYVMTVFTLAWGTSELGFTRERFLLMQLVGVACFAATIPISAAIAERGRRRMLFAATAAIGLFGLVMGPLFERGTAGAVATLAIGLGLMGLTYGPLGTAVATALATRYGVASVGYYVTAVAALTWVGLMATRETMHDSLHDSPHDNMGEDLNTSSRT
jgi:MFS family permease